MKSSRPLVVALAASSMFATGCANTSPQQTSRPYDSRPYDSTYESSSSQNTTYGVIESIDVVTTNREKRIGVGAVIGGIVGGLLGNQVGGGSGKTLATVAGVAGGAVVGNEIQKRRNANEVYHVRVRANRGDNQTLELDDIGNLRVGDRVRVQNGTIYQD